jgi:hypothetical protein
MSQLHLLATLLLRTHWIGTYHSRENSFIQGVSRLVDISAGGDFLGLCDQCVRFWTVTELWSFFNSRTRPRVNLVLRNQLAGNVLNLVAYRLRCKHYFCHMTRPPSYRQSSFRISTLGRYLRNAGIGLGGYSPGQCILHDSATTTCSKTLITYITVTVPAADVQNSFQLQSMQI